MKIFINYRRVDSADVAGRIYDRLVDKFGKSNIYKDVDSISLGIDFREQIKSLLMQSELLLVVIGLDWLDCKNDKGERRIDDTEDYVRFEIEIGLQRQIPIIPLLVRGTQMPSAEKLPASIQELAYRNGTHIRPDPDFHNDMNRLIYKLQKKSESIDEVKEAQDVGGQLTRKEVLKAIESARIKGETPDLRNVSLVGIDLNGENLSGVDFTKADLSFADLEQANLENAILQRANLDNANLFRTHMKNVNLRRASLVKTDLIKPTLTNADLSEVDLKPTNVDFDDADLAHAKLFRTDLSNVDLKRTILTGAEYSSDTIWPDGFEPEKAVTRNSITSEDSLLLYFHRNPPYNAAKMLYVGSEIAKDLKVEISYVNSESVLQTKTVIEFFPKEDPRMMWHHYKHDFLEPNQVAYFHLVKNKSTSNGKAKVTVSFIGAKSGKFAKIEKEFDLEVF